MLNPLYKAIGYLLAVFYSIVPSHNLGVAIILLTCTVMLALFPLTAKQARSMISMQKVQPEIKRLQAKYKNDKQKQNEEILKFYQENKINPLAGCLPLVMQFPIFISLFHVLRSVQSNVPKTGRFDLLYHDICGSSTTSCPNPVGLRFLGMDLSKSLWQVRGTSFITVLPYVISILLVIFTGWYQARQTMARQQSAPAATPVNSQMQFMTKVFPIVFGVLSLRFASGLVVYWITSNTWRIGQQHLVLNKIYDTAQNAPPPKSSSLDDDDPPADEGTATDKPKKAIPRPGAPKRDPNRTNGSGSAKKPSNGNGSGNAGKSGNGSATPAPTSGSRRKKRKR